MKEFLPAHVVPLDERECRRWWREHNKMFEDNLKDRLRAAGLTDNRFAICNLEQCFHAMYTRSGLLDDEFNLNSVSRWVTNVARDALHMKEVTLSNFVRILREVRTAIDTLLMLKNIPSVLRAGERCLEWEDVLQVLDAADDENHHSPTLHAVGLAWRVWLEHPGVLPVCCFY